jgi:hypothetical protein
VFCDQYKIKSNKGLGVKMKVVVQVKKEKEEEEEKARTAVLGSVERLNRTQIIQR